jgi:hypothetical protein
MDPLKDNACRAFQARQHIRLRLGEMQFFFLFPGNFYQQETVILGGEAWNTPFAQR